MSQVVTGEAVTVDLREARVGSRLIAVIIDFAAQFAIALLLLLVLSRTALLSGDEALVTAFALVGYVAVTLGYPVALETLWRGRTLGKAAMGLRVVRDDGGPIRFRHAFVRGLIGVFERPGPLLGAPALICMLFTRRAKRIGDVLAGTVVLQERVPTAPLTMAQMPPRLAGWATTLDLSRLPDPLALSARQFLARAGQLSPAPRERLGGQLVAEVQRVVTPQPPPGTPGWAYLAAVLAERRRREEVRLGIPPSAGATVHGGWVQGAWGQPAGAGPSLQQGTAVAPDPVGAGYGQQPAGAPDEGQPAGVGGWGPPAGSDNWGRPAGGSGWGPPDGREGGEQPAGGVPAAAGGYAPPGGYGPSDGQSGEPARESRPPVDDPPPLPTPEAVPPSPFAPPG